MAINNKKHRSENPFLVAKLNLEKNNSGGGEESDAGGDIGNGRGGINAAAGYAADGNGVASFGSLHSSFSNELESAEDTERRSNNLRTSRKSFALPLVFDLAMKNLKEDRNLTRHLRKEKGKVSEDEIMSEALGKFFDRPENRKYLEQAKEKLANLS